MPLTHAASGGGRSEKGKYRVQLYSVTELAEYLRASMESNPQLQDLWLSGEVSNLVTSASGHTYFTLRDERAALRCVLFKGKQGAEHLANGGGVNAHGNISFYETRGETQLYVDAVQPAGLGVLEAEFQRLLEQLRQEGLFDESRKRELPAFPHRIGVVTSDTGAVFHDVVNVLSERYPLAEVVLCASMVQGDDAPAQIASAIQTLNELGDIDVIIVGRGGGSLEDLWAFNTEEVARAIYASHVPIVSAVGHETDVTIADFVADYRAPTPSAAAMAVSPDAQTLAYDVSTLVQRGRGAVSYAMSGYSRDVAALVERLKGRLPDTAGLRQRIDDLLAVGRSAVTRLLEQRTEQTRTLAAALSALGPAAVLARGYASLAYAETGAQMVSADAVRVGDALRATLHDGAFDTEVITTGVDAHPHRAARQEEPQQEQTQQAPQPTPKRTTRRRKDRTIDHGDGRQPALL